MKRWFADTLSKRLLLLMWVALVASHVLAFAVVSWLHFPQRQGGTESVFDHLPTFPSLPPTPGLPDNARRPTPTAPPQEHRDGPHDGPHTRPSLPWDALALDYGVRFAVIAAAAWFGSRWLARPMRRLVEASRALGDSISSHAALPMMNEAGGTLEVREAAHVFNTMASQLREQFQARGLMVAAISHDLRTPLARLRIRLESMTASPELQQRSVADIQEMNELIDNVLDVFRPENPAGGEPFQPTDIAALVQAITDDLAEQGEAITFDGSTAIARIRPKALRRVIDNLVGNALRYGTRAEVSVVASRDEVRIVIDDAGPGIPAAELEAVFQPFYRVDASRNRHTGGTGLGLYIARDLVHRQGGTLTLANRLGGGLRAQIVLPAVIV